MSPATRSEPLPSSRRRRRRAAASAGVLTALSLVAAPATGARPDEVTLTRLGTFSTGSVGTGAAEIVAHDPGTQRAFVVNAEAGQVQVLDIRDPRAPRQVAALSTPGANSVDVHDGLVAVARQAEPKTDPGHVTFYDASSLRPVRELTVGALPDMLTFTGDGSRVVVANEGEPEGYCAGQVDPEGSISVVDLGRGVRRASVRTAGFTAFDDDGADLRAAGVRLPGPGASVAEDLEPEYVAVSGDGRTARVSLQEANAVAVVDLRSARVRQIIPLGTKDHRRRGQGLDPSDVDGRVAIARRPVEGMTMPDAIHALPTSRGEHTITADEGDGRDYDCYSDEVRAADLTLDPRRYPDADEVQRDDALGRLTVAADSPAGADGVTSLRSFGGRSVSIWAPDGSLAWDSGDALERLVAREHPEDFNSTHEENDSFDSRSDAKGPEPEGLDVGVLGGRSYAFVGLERDSGIAVLDVTDPRSGRVVGYATGRDFAGDPADGSAGDLGPEGLLFIPAEESPSGEPLLVVGNEVSGTTTLWQVDAPGDDG